MNSIAAGRWYPRKTRSRPSGPRPSPTRRKATSATSSTYIAVIAVKTEFGPQQVSGHDPHPEDKWFKPYCPIRNVTAKYPPTMLIHGTADTDVPYLLSKDMAATLGKAGVAHEFITVEGAEHGLAGAKPEEVSRIAARAVEFVKAHTA
jgi:pimeloyl-ACP methyl ester carboxylesterase